MYNVLKYCKILLNVALRLRCGCVYFFNLLKTSTVHDEQMCTQSLTGDGNNQCLDCFCFRNVGVVVVVDGTPAVDVAAMVKIGVVAVPEGDLSTGVTLTADGTRLAVAVAAATEESGKSHRLVVYKRQNNC